MIARDSAADYQTLKARTKTRARLYVDLALQAGAELELGADQSHYLRSVMRVQPGEAVLVFNGHDGEWRADILEVGKKAVRLICRRQTRAQAVGDDLWLCFAPLKKETTHFAVEKASELGASCILPVSTRYTRSDRFRQDRLQAVAMEAAEQCEALTVPQVAELQSLQELLAAWSQERVLLVCAEIDTSAAGERRDLLGQLQRYAHRPLAFMVGPEGGWHTDELALLANHPAVALISLGPRILRAETAVAVALGGYQLWRDSQEARAEA